MKKINKNLSLCIALALMQSVYVSNSFAADATEVTNQGSRYYFGVGTEPTLEDLSKKGIIDYKKASQKSQNNNENGEGAGPNALDKNNYGALAAGMGAFASHGYRVLRSVIMQRLLSALRVWALPVMPLVTRLLSVLMHMQRTKALLLAIIRKVLTALP